MELRPEKIAAASDAVLEIIDSTIKGAVTDDQLKRAKVQMRAAHVRGMQTSENVAATLATDLLTSADPHFSDRYLKRIDQLTTDDIKRVAAKYFVRDRLITTAMLPSEFVGAGRLAKVRGSFLRPEIAPTTKRKSLVATTRPVVTRTKLANGVILLHKQITTTPLVEVKMYALGGLTEETADDNGIGNLAMEMLPRGTKSRTSRQLAEFFDSIGGTVDTGCGNNSWFWNTTCLKGDFEKTMDVLSDVVANPAFDDAELGQMKKRIGAAIESEDADWNAQTMRFFKKTYFGPMNSPYQFLAIGTKDNLAKFKSDDLKKFYADHVLHAPRVLAIYGDIDLEKAKQIAEQRFGGGAAVDNSKPASVVVANADDGASKAGKLAFVEVDRVEVEKTDQPLAGVMIGYDSSSVIGDPANYAISVANTMCSGFGYPTGYLFETLRGLGETLSTTSHARTGPAGTTNCPARSSSSPGAIPIR